MGSRGNHRVLGGTTSSLGEVREASQKSYQSRDRVGEQSDKNVCMGKGQKQCILGGKETTPGNERCLSGELNRQQEGKIVEDVAREV